MRSTFCAATAFTLLLICSITAFTTSTVSKGFQVTEVFLKADDDGRPTGPCPLRVTFRGYITANGPGTIKYTFTRSDGATGPVYIMEFKRAGTQPVMTDWTLGDARVLPRYAGWQAVKVLSPAEIESSHETGSFEINCGGKDASQGFPVNVRPAAPDNNPVDAGRLTAEYEVALPAIADSQLLLFRTKLEKLKSLNDEFEIKLDRAPKSANFSKQQLQDEFSAILKEQDLKKRSQRIEEFQDRYQQEFTEQMKTAGIDVAAERQRMISLFGSGAQQEISPEAVSNASRMLAVTTVMKAVDDRPPVEAAPEFYTDEFGCPFTAAGVRGRGTANHRDGTLAIRSDSTLGVPGSTQSLAFATQYMSARRGARRMIISVALNDLNFSLSGGAVYGFASAEAAVSLRIFKDGRVVASRRVSLRRFDAVLFGFASLNERLAARTLELEITRSHPAEPGNYLTAIEFESSASSLLGGWANLHLTGRVGPFTVRTY